LSETAARHKAEAPKSLNFAVITISTSRSREFAETGRLNDPSGDLIVEALKARGHRVTLRRIVTDDKDAIQTLILKTLKSLKTDAIITTGGTGIAPKDVTIEAVKPMLEKEIPGFGELFRAISYQKIGSATILTRAIAGVARGKAVFCLPGSPQSASLAVQELILPEVGHIIKHGREK